MQRESAQTKRCPECRRTVDAAGMRPLSRSSYGAGLRYVCPDCFARVQALRKVARDTARQTIRQGIRASSSKR